MEIVLKKIFLEQNNSGHKMRFGDLYNGLKDYCNNNKIDHTKYCSPSDPVDSELSTFCLCVFTLLKTNNENILQRELVEKYIGELVNLINDTNYMDDDSDVIGCILSVFDSSSSNRIHSNSYVEFKNIYKLLEKQFKKGEYHSGYLIQLSLGTLAYANLIKNENQENYSILFANFIDKLKQMVLFDDEFCVYSRPNCREYVNF